LRYIFITQKLVLTIAMTPKAVIQTWIDAFNRADADALANLYANEAVNHQVMFEPVFPYIFSKMESGPSWNGKIRWDSEGVGFSGL